MRQVKQAIRFLAPLFLFTCMVFSLAGCTIQAREEYVNQNPELRKKIDEKYKQVKKAVLVYTTRDIPEGDTIAAKDLLEKYVDIYGIPENAVPQSASAIGKKAKYGMAEGQVVQVTDLSDEAAAHVIRISLSDAEYALVEKQAEKAGTNADDLLNKWVKSKVGK